MLIGFGAVAGGVEGADADLISVTTSELLVESDLPSFSVPVEQVLPKSTPKMINSMSIATIIS